MAVAVAGRNSVLFLVAVEEETFSASGMAKTLVASTLVTESELVAVLSDAQHVVFLTSSAKTQDGRVAHCPWAVPSQAGPLPAPPCPTPHHSPLHADLGETSRTNLLAYLISLNKEIVLVTLTSMIETHNKLLLRAPSWRSLLSR